LDEVFAVGIGSLAHPAGPIQGRAVIQRPGFRMARGGVRGFKTGGGRVPRRGFGSAGVPVRPWRVRVRVRGGGRRPP